ncbi:MAG: hypothetical protein HOP34_12690 [Methylococcaceae bacterium]|nr:hypothetical protein [Methylococcaceae bacterium]
MASDNSNGNAYSDTTKPLDERCEPQQMRQHPNQHDTKSSTRNRLHTDITCRVFRSTLTIAVS